MIKGLVSVVVPIYNVEKYLERCVSSIAAQTYTNLEIILVDDGSPDNCPQLCEQWVCRDSRIKVIHKENAGLGMARNTGIENATGEYICFFDSDDYVDRNTIEQCYQVAKESDADMVCFGMRYVNAEGKVTGERIPAPPKQLFSGDEVRKVFLPALVAPDPKTGENFNISMSACCKMFSMKTIEKRGWRFVSERQIISEDFYSLLGLYRDVETVAVLPQAFYSYCQNGSSLTHTYRPDRYRQVRHFYHETVKLCRELDYPEEVARRFRGPYLSFVISALKQEVMADRSVAEQRESVKKIIDDQTLQDVLFDIRKEPQDLTKKILFFAMRYKLYSVCFGLLKLKAR